MSHPKHHASVRLDIQHQPLIKTITLLTCLMLLLSGCSKAATPEAEATAPPTAPVATTPPTAAAAITDATPAESAAGSPEALPTSPPTDLAVSFPLSEPGPYYAGSRSLKLVDESRGGREVRLTLWYPALKETDANGNVIRNNAKPDLSGAPYPLVLTGSNSGDMLFHEHLATHGMVTAIVRSPGFHYTDPWGANVFVNYPQDLLFVLDQLAANPAEDMAGVIDTDRSAVAGYSYDGSLALALSGARIDPGFHKTWCEGTPAHQPPYEEWYIEYVCGMAGSWDAIAAAAGQEITASEDGLWQPITDERIRAVMPMAPDGAWVYGDKGLAAADRPALMVQATKDSPYQPAEGAFILENLGAAEKGMVSFIGKDHFMIMDPEVAAKIRHLAVAFLGYHLQGREDYQQYFSQDFISQFDDLAWGFFQDE